MTTYDIEALRQIINGLRNGKDVDFCFIAATGSPFDEFEKEWQDYVRKTHKWMWFYELDEYVWFLIFALLFVAFILQKIRNKRIEEQWQQEQQRIQDMENEDM